jgi:V8-like Glu-specific endopeptidase
MAQRKTIIASTIATAEHNASITADDVLRASPALKTELLRVATAETHAARLTRTVGQPTRQLSLASLRSAMPSDTLRTEGFQPGSAPRIADDSDRAMLTSLADAETIAQELSPAQSLKYPHRCVGRVSRREPGKQDFEHAGSGSLIGPWHMLTASHVINSSPAGTEYRFTPAYYDGPRYTDSGFKKHIANIISHIGIDTAEVNGYDYVVCELDTPLGLEWGWLGASSGSNDDFYTNPLWTTFGYPTDLADGERMQAGHVSIDSVEDDKHGGKALLGEGDIYYGWSGGPLTGPQLWTGTDAIAVASGSSQGSGHTDPDHVTFAGGPDMVRLVKYARDNWVRYEWTPFYGLGGAFKPGTSISTLTRTPGMTEMFGCGTDGRLWQQYAPHETTGDWSGWYQVDPNFELAGTPTVCNDGVANLHVFGLSASGAAWHKSFNDTSGWSSFRSLGGGFKAGSTLAAISRRPGQLEVFGRGLDDKLWQNFRLANGQWNGWYSLGANGFLMTGSPSVIARTPDTMHVFARDASGQLATYVWQDHLGAWAGWFGLGGSFHPGDSVGALSRVPGQIELFGRGVDNRLWQNYSPVIETGDWSGWYRVDADTEVAGSPSATSPIAEDVRVVARAGDGSAIIKYYHRIPA